MKAFTLSANESFVRAPFYSAVLRPDTPFSFEDEHSPWGGWLCDRFVSFFDMSTFEEEADYEEMTNFIASPTAETATALARLLQGSHSFDGSVAFIPSSHAEDFYAHLEQFVANSLAGVPGDTSSPDNLNLGSDNSDPVSYWGSTTSDGLFLLFSTSCDAYDEDWLGDAFQCYPARDEIIAPKDASCFDPRYAFFHNDSHLSDHLYPSRHENNELYVSFLKWAKDKGYLRVMNEEDEA